MAETRRKFDEDFRQGAIEVARRDIRRARIGRSEIGGVAAQATASPLATPLEKEELELTGRGR